MSTEVDKTVNNDFEKTLIESGYKFFKDNWKKSLRGFQKKFTDDKGVKYFITGYHYNFAKQYPDQEAFKNHTDDKYHFDVQFNKDRAGKSQCIDIQFSADFLPNEYRPVTTLKEVEDFFENIFVSGGFEYYELDCDYL